MRIYKYMHPSERVTEYGQILPNTTVPDGVGQG